MTYTVKNNEVQLVDLRTDDDLALSVTADYDISIYTIKFLVKLADGSVVDLSQFVTVIEPTKYVINVLSEEMKTIENAVNYTIVVVRGVGDEDFQFGGNMKVTRGIS